MPAVENGPLQAITNAAVELCNSDAPLKERLLATVRLLNVVLVRREEWQVMLRRQAQEIADELNSHVTP